MNTNVFLVHGTATAQSYSSNTCYNKPVLCGDSVKTHRYLRPSERNEQLKVTQLMPGDDATEMSHRLFITSIDSFYTRTAM